MDLFQPVTLLVGKDGDAKPIHFANLRLAVLNVMKELEPDKRACVRICGRDGMIDFPGISKLFEDLRPTKLRTSAGF